MVEMVLHFLYVLHRFNYLVQSLAKVVVLRNLHLLMVINQAHLLLAKAMNLKIFHFS
jgi:hypothetical protein